MGEWTKAREAQHRRMFPPEEKAARQREATARYRETHAKRIALVRTVTNILMRQDWSRGDPQALATAIVALLGKDCAKELRKEIGAALDHHSLPSAVDVPSS